MKCMKCILTLMKTGFKEDIRANMLMGEVTCRLTDALMKMGLYLKYSKGQS